MAIITVQCPSGLVGDVRECRGREIRALEDAPNPFLTIIEGCWVKTLNPGPYTLHDGAKPRWSEVLAGDILQALLKVGEAGFGTKRSVPFECHDADCRRRDPDPTIVELDTTQLEVKPITPEVLQQFVNGNRFEITVAGFKVWFKFSTGATLDAACRAQKKDHKFKLLVDSIYEIEGLAHQFDLDKQDWLDDLSSDDLTELGRKIGELEPGPQRNLKVRCQWCGRERTHLLPFGLLATLR